MKRKNLSKHKKAYNQLSHQSTQRSKTAIIEDEKKMNIFRLMLPIVITVRIHRGHQIRNVKVGAGVASQ